MTTRFGFSKRSHLRKTDEISSVFDFRCRETGLYLTALAKPNTVGNPRLAIMVARKVASRAVARNYMRRVLREAFRHSQQELGNFDIVIRVNRPFDRFQAGPVREELLKHFSRISKCQNSSSG